MRIYREGNGTRSGIIELGNGADRIDGPRFTIESIYVNLDDAFVGEFFPETVAAIVKSNAVCFLPVCVYGTGCVAPCCTGDGDGTGIGE